MTGIIAGNDTNARAGLRVGHLKKSACYSITCALYCVISGGTDIQAFNAQLANYLERYAPGTVFTLEARPYASAYLHGRYE